MSFRLTILLGLFLAHSFSWAKDDGTPALEQILATGPVAPGLYVDAGRPAHHELRSAREFAEILKRKLGFQVVLMTGSRTFNTPGFDGVILSSSGAPVANFSLKTSNRSGERVLGEIADVALQKMRSYSRLKKWEETLTWVSYNQRQRQRNQVDMERWLTILQPDSPRPQWLLLHLTSRDVTEERVLSLREKTRGTEQTIVVIDATTIYVFQDGEERSLEVLRDCEQNLGG